MTHNTCPSRSITDHPVRKKERLTHLMAPKWISSLFPKIAGQIPLTKHALCLESSFRFDPLNYFLDSSLLINFLRDDGQTTPEFLTIARLFEDRWTEFESEIEAESDK
jgi:hypothetical protein